MAMRLEKENVRMIFEQLMNDVPLASGPKSTMPDVEQRKSMREGGCKIYVEGKIFKEVKKQWHLISV